MKKRIDESSALLPMRGEFRITARDRDGRVIEQAEELNLIVLIGRRALAKLIAGQGVGQEVTRIGFGTNTAAAVAADTALTSSYTKAITSATVSTDPGVASVTFVFSLDYGEANGKLIAEFGLLNTAETVLFARRVRTAISKQPDIRLDGTWTIIF